MSFAASNIESTAPAQQVAVVLCCTAADAQVVSSLSQALRDAQPVEPQVILLEGEQFDELASLAKGYAGSTVLYVLCRGAEISVPEIQKVRAVLRGHAGGQFMTVQVSTVERMKAALVAALSGPRFSSGAPANPPATIRGIPAANSGPANRSKALPGPRGMATNPPRAPRAPARSPRTLLGGTNPPQPSKVPPSAPSTMMGAVPPPEGRAAPAFGEAGPATMMGAAPPPEGRPVPSFGDAGPRTMMGAAPPPEGNPMHQDGPRTMMGAAVPPEGPVPMPSGMVEPGLGGGWPSHEDEASISGSATVTFGAPMQQSFAVERAQEPQSRLDTWKAQGQEVWEQLWNGESRNLKLGVAAGLIFLIPTFALLVWFGLSGSDKEEAKVAQASDTPARELAAKNAPDAGPSLKGQGPDEDEPLALQAEDEEDEPSSPNAAKGKLQEAAPLDEDELTARKYNEFLRVEAALRRSKIRGLDSLVIDTSRSRKYTFRSARRYCNRKESAKLSGWRLPSARELSRIGSANLTGKGSYWAQPSSRSKSRQAQVWDSKRKKLVRKSSSYRGARAICVRDRVSTAGD